jgi:hypothetical protein
VAVRSFFPGDFLIEPSANRPSEKCHYCKALAFAAGLGLSMLSYPVHAAPNSGDTVERLNDALLSTMKNGRQLSSIR